MSWGILLHVLSVLLSQRGLGSLFLISDFLTEVKNFSPHGEVLSHQIVEFMFEGFFILEDFYILGLVLVDVVLQGIIAVLSLLLDIIRESEN